MDRADLEIFRTVAREGNITQAARELNFVQSNVTAQIKKLESELGVTLFYRHSRGVSLTPAGRLLLPHADRILHLFEEAGRVVKGDGRPAGPLAIGSMESTAAIRLPAVLAAYHRQFSEVDLALTTGPTEHLVEAVLAYKLDGALVGGPIQHPDLLQEPVIQEKLVLVSDPSHPEGSALSDLVRQPILVFRAGCSYRARLENWLRSEGFLPVRILEFGTLEGILGSVRAGFGVSLVPYSVAEAWERMGLLVCHPRPESYGKATTLFVRRRDSMVTPALSAFLDLLHSEVGSVPV